MLAKQPTTASSTAVARPARGSQKAARAAKTERTQLAPQDWMRAAAELLIHRSIDAVRVDVLAKILEVTRGSFYWHFADRDDLLVRSSLHGHIAAPCGAQTWAAV